MNLLNLNVDEINKAIISNYSSACSSLLTMRDENFLSFLQTAGKVFGKGLKLSLVEDVSYLSRAVISRVGEEEGAIILTTDNRFGKQELTFCFDDDLGYWLLLGSHLPEHLRIGRSIMLTQMLSPILEFEANLVAFKTIEMLNRLREP